MRKNRGSEREREDGRKKGRNKGGMPRKLVRYLISHSRAKEAVKEAGVDVVTRAGRFSRMGWGVMDAVTVPPFIAPT
jgi:hypothetical protein